MTHLLRYCGVLQSSALLLVGTAVAAPAELNQSLLDLSPNRWHEIHQDSDSRLAWRRQGHSGADFDSQRGRIIVFGSDTHRQNTDNAVHIFDPVTLSWSEPYPEDDASTYTLNDAGYVQAPNHRPVAMHTFGATAYIDSTDRFFTASRPAHNSNIQIDANINRDDITVSPNWIFNPANNSWTIHPISDPQPVFFASSIVYDSDRNVLVGLGNGSQNGGITGTWELDFSGNNTWQRVNNRSASIHNNAVYDSINKKVLEFGRNDRTTEVHSYTSADGWVIENTPGDRPPADQHIPLAFDSDNGVMLAVVDNTNTERAETWAYNNATDSWTRVLGADIQELLTLHYLMVYDRFHKLAYLIVDGAGGSPRVLAMRFDPANNTSAGPDNDSDGILDADDPDDDNDQLPDSFETANGLDPFDDSDANSDADNDNLTARQEFELNTNPNNPDTDGDDLRDDVDDNPTTAADQDTDGDGQPDNIDLDDDNDGIPDSFEERNGGNPKDASDAQLDNDNDNLSALQEYLAGTDPNNADTDGDNLQDGNDSKPLLQQIPTAQLNQRLLNLSPNQWHLISQDSDQRLNWRRQSHGSGVVDAANARLMIFGADRRGSSTDDAVHVFNAIDETWSELYPSAGASTYQLGNDGILRAPNNRPPAMVVYGSMAYGRLGGEMVIASSGSGNTEVFSESGIEKDSVTVWPTWLLNINTGEWNTITDNGAQPPSFRTMATTYDLHRNVVIGLGNATQNRNFGGTWELDLHTREWSKRNNTSFTIHPNAVYDSRNRAVLSFGRSGNPDTVMALPTGAADWQEMPTPGTRPPGDQHVPLAFDEDNGVMLAVVDNDDTDQAETWVYNFATDSWNALPNATFADHLNINYTMGYDPQHGVALLATGGTGNGNRPTEVYALKFDPNPQSGGNDDGDDDSDGDNPDPTPSNSAPSVTSATPLSAETGNQVNLQATATDSDGTIARYQWQQLTGTQVTLNNANSATANFTAPSSAGQLSFRVTVTDDDEAENSTTVIVDVTTPTPPADASIASSTSLEARTVAEGSRNVLMNRVLIQAPSGGTGYQLQSITIDAEGDGNDAQDIRNVKLFIDSEGNGLQGQHDQGDQSIGNSVFTQDNGTITFTFNTPISLAPGAQINVLVVYDFE